MAQNKGKHMFVKTTLITAILLAQASFADRPIPSSPEELTSTVEISISNADVEIAEIIAIPNEERTFANTVGALDDMMVRLDGDANMMAFMAYVHEDADIREAAQGAEQM